MHLQFRNCFYLSVSCETIMTRPIEHDKVRDALFFQLEPILPLGRLRIDVEDSFEAYPYFRKVIRRTIENGKGL